MEIEQTKQYPTISQFKNYTELLKHSEQIPLQEFQAMASDQMPRFAEGLFDEPPGPGMRRKRKKLADFTANEKQARRKLKNRIAAQSARDRKRIETEMQCKSLDDLKAEVERLRAENISLRADNTTLRTENNQLRAENNDLRKQDRPTMDRTVYIRNPPSSGSSSRKASPKRENLMTVNAANDDNVPVMTAPSARFDPQVGRTTSPFQTNNVAHVSPTTVGHVYATVSNQANPAEGLLMHQKETTANKPVIRAPTRLQQNNVNITDDNEREMLTSTTATPNFQTMQAMYTLVLTILFQTASNIVNTRATTSCSRELNKRLRTIALIKKIKETRRQPIPSSSSPTTSQLRHFPQPIAIWETGPQAESPKVPPTKRTRMSTPTPHLLDHSTNKIPKTVSSTTSCCRSRSPALRSKASTHYSTIPSQTISSTGGPDRMCPIHPTTRAYTANCHGCVTAQGSKKITISKATLNKINIADHVVRQVTLQKVNAAQQHVRRVRVAAHAPLQSQQQTNVSKTENVVNETEIVSRPTTTSM